MTLADVLFIISCLFLIITRLSCAFLFTPPTPPQVLQGKLVEGLVSLQVPSLYRVLSFKCSCFFAPFSVSMYGLILIKNILCIL